MSHNLMLRQPSITITTISGRWQCFINLARGAQHWSFLLLDVVQDMSCEAVRVECMTTAQQLAILLQKADRW